MARVALAHNLIPVDMLRYGPIDRSAELDSEVTIAAVTEALTCGGHQVIPVNVDRCLSEALKAAQPDIVFNIAEGLQGESRESQVPALCELLGIPYTGSGVLTLALCLDKARTKQVLTCCGIPTPAFQVFSTPHDLLSRSLRFPMIVKLLHEGSSMGLSPASVVDDEDSLRRQVRSVMDTYRQPALVEEFIEGREFSVGLLGNSPWPRVLPILEYTFSRPRGIVLYVPDDSVMVAISQARHGDSEFDCWQRMYTVTPEFICHDTVCPADVNVPLRRMIEMTAANVFYELGVRDWGRMEMRLGPDGRLYVLEINPIAGIDPTYSLARAAGCAGMSYADMINVILDSAMERYGLPR